MRTEKFETKLSGMICPECEDEAAAALLHTRGVISADVSYRSAAARITYDPDITCTAQICRALSEAGYPPGSRGRSGVIADICAAFAVVLLTVFIPKLTALVAVPRAEAGAGYGALFVIGLLTGVHCIGMCGGIMLTQAGAARKSRFSGPALYNLGRVISYAAAGGAPLLAADSYTAVFRGALLSLGTDFDPAEPDAKSVDYAKIYNELAQCAYNGGLSAAASMPGELPCTLAWSTALGGILPASLSVSLAPLPEGGSEQRPAELLGIAVLRHENQSPDAAAFTDWLCGRERLSKLALDSGLVPVSELGSVSDSPLLELYDCGKLKFMDIDGGAEQEFDAQFRRTIELLS